MVAVVLNMTGFVSEPVLLLAYPGLPCAGACGNPQQSFVCRAEGLSAGLWVMLSFDWEMWSAPKLCSRLTCQQNHSNHVLTFSSTNPFWVSQLSGLFNPR